MTLTEAIEHCEATVAEKEAQAKFYKTYLSDEADNLIAITECQDCAKEHEQLADWLRELKQYQERDIVHCKECIFSTMTTTGECAYCDVWFPNEKKYVSGDHFCAYGEKKTD